MSGICGIYGKGDVDEMTRILSHRGPDDMGFYIEGSFQLGVRRLAIFDIKGGNQPIGNERQDMWIALDGNIFNYEDIRKDLISKGHKFRTETDTEVIVHAWEQWGEECLNMFNGQFAFALWDGKTLYLVRDRIGEKPLYYYQRGKRLLFASEIKSLLTQIKGVSKFTDEFRDFDTPFFNDTLFSGIWEVPPGHYILFNSEKSQITRWWDFPKNEGPYRSEREYVDELRWLLEDCVKIRTKGEVPFCSLVSGGVDSAWIACTAKPEHIYTVTFREKGEAYDELELAKIVAQKSGSKLHIIRPNANDLKAYLPKIIWHLDYPTGSMSSLALFMAAQQASKKSKSMLIGQGADELFGGHVRYLLMIAEYLLGKEPALQNYLPLARYFWNQDIFSDPADRYYSMLSHGPGIDPKVRGKIRELFKQQNHLIDQMGFTDMQISLPNVLAMDDRAASAFGMENRNPFLDHRLIEFAFRIPPKLKVNGFESKIIFKKAMRGVVPDEILNRTDKMGLAVPVGPWFKKELKRWSDIRIKRFRERYEANFLNAAWDAAGSRGTFDRRDYMRVCLEIWMDTMINKDDEKFDKIGFSS
jgi:asparagine synthase (glutamine-hydrolysing)